MATENKTKETDKSVTDFISTLDNELVINDCFKLVDLMSEISGHEPKMWGPSIIGFGSQHYKYDTGREGDMPQLAFSPRKANLTIYFEGFDRYGKQLAKLGKHKQSVSCLYINKLADIKLNVLREMLEMSFTHADEQSTNPSTVDDYIASVPVAARPKFDELRQLVKKQLPHADEVLSYGIVGYKIDNKRARVFISGWKDHVAMYPVPKSNELQAKLTPYIKGKGTVWFNLNEPLPKSLLEKVVQYLAS